MLKLSNIAARYGSARVLDDISMEINDQEIVAIVGSNGAGKTSLVNVIMGILKVAAGEILFLNKNITALPAHDRAEMGIAIVPEGRRLFPQMTVEENLLVGGIAPRVRTKRQESIEDIYQTFPRLKERRNQRAATLSGGEQQMLAIGRALMSHPKLVVFDEPSLGLAPKIVTEVFLNIKKISSDRRMTVLLIEQNVTLSLQFSSRAYVMENGKVVIAGESHELLDNPYIKKAYLGI
ncbi:MAG: ABC transporter ATP-binding protein [Bellilinea sp.]|jgi:branched-chain amino acid transport system ATP-binding protein